MEYPFILKQLILKKQFSHWFGMQLLKLHKLKLLHNLKLSVLSFYNIVYYTQMLKTRLQNHWNMQL